MVAWAPVKCWWWGACWRRAWRWSRIHNVLEQDLHAAIDEWSCGSDHGGGDGGGGGSEEEEYVEERRGKSLSRLGA